MKIKFGRFVFIIPAAAAFAAGFNSLWNGFVWDDGVLISDQLRAFGSFLGALFFDTGIYQMDAYYRPVVIGLHYLNYQAWGPNPFGFHLMLLLVHMLNSVLVYLLAVQLLDEYENPGEIAIASSLVFAVHPMHSEATAWVSGMPDALSATFIMLSFIFFIRLRKGGAVIPLTALTAVFLFLALSTKETSAMIPVIFLVYDALKSFPGDDRERSGGLLSRAGGIISRVRLSPRRYTGLLAVYAASLAGALLYLAARLKVTGSLMPRGIFPEVSLFQKLSLVAKAYMLYAMKLLAPVWPDPFIPDIPRSSDFMVLSLILAVLLAWLLYRSLFAFKTAPAISLWWAVLFLLPGASIAAGGLVIKAAERYTYISLAGFSILVALSLFSAIKAPRARAAVIMALVIAGTGLSIWRNSVWRDETALWTAASLRQPEHGFVRNNLGVAYLRAGQFSKAEKEFKEALLLSRNAPGRSKAATNLALVAVQMKDPDMAEKNLLLAISEDPSDPKPPYILGSLLAEKAGLDSKASNRDMLVEAARHLENAVRLDNYNSSARRRLAMVYSALGMNEKAENELRILNGTGEVK